MLHGASSNIKPTSRCIGIDDGPFPPKYDHEIRRAPLLAVWLKGPHLERLRAGQIIVDGLDATAKAVTLLRGTLRIPVLLSGVTFGGFNLIDPFKIQKSCKSPVIVVIGNRPDNTAVKRALSRHFVDWKQRWDLIRSLGPLQRTKPMSNEPPLFFECVGCSTHEAGSILKDWALVSRIPEPVRVAGILARGLFPPKPSA